jgi:hypothetical protein
MLFVRRKHTILFSVSLCLIDDSVVKVVIPQIAPSPVSAKDLRF